MSTVASRGPKFISLLARFGLVAPKFGSHASTKPLESAMASFAPDSIDVEIRVASQPQHRPVLHHIASNTLSCERLQTHMDELDIGEDFAITAVKQPRI